MRIKVPEYKGKHRILSIAVDEKVKEDLDSEEVEFLYVSKAGIYVYPEGYILTDDLKVIETFEDASNYDVFELYEDGTLVRCYEDQSSENIFFITEKCNSNCTMCPMPEYTRRRGNTSNIDNLISIASHIPSDVPHMTITGGEPFMVGKELFRLLEYCRDKFENTEFQLLTNGRILALDEYCRLLEECAPNHLILGIPLHGSNPRIHDGITQVAGSFEQTLSGLRKLQNMEITTEIRLVVCKDNLNDLEAISNLIAHDLGKTAFVSIMAMEMTGNARINRENVWIPYRESFRFVRPAVETLINSGIDVRLYNFPLCTVDSDMRMICFKSISSWKVRYGDECDICSVKKACGGVFAGTFNLESGELKPIR